MTASRDIYGTSPRYWAPEPTPELSESEQATRNLMATLRERTDRGAAFWDALREAGEQIADGPPRRHQPKQDDREHLVYYLRFGDRIKIGTTTNLPLRLSAIPHDVLLATEPGDRKIERDRHRQFERWRIKGEWFEVNDELLAHIATLTT